MTYGQLTRQPVNVAPPCDFCAAGQKVPIGAMVAARRPPNNDNALVSLAADVYESPDGPLRLDLPCGQYYLTQIASSSHVTIVAHGRTALYVDGDINPDGLSLSVAPGGEFDVFVAGSIGTSGALRIGSPNYPALTRVYVDGSSGVTISDNVAIAGNLYAPNGPVTYSSAAEHTGAVYAGNFSTSKRLALHYDRAVINQGDKCPPPTGPDGGTPPCGTCKDCGNQACINGTCGACTTSAQCCPRSYVRADALAVYPEMTQSLPMQMEVHHVAQPNHKVTRALHTPAPDPSDSQSVLLAPNGQDAKRRETRPKRLDGFGAPQSKRRCKVTTRAPSNSLTLRQI